MMKIKILLLILFTTAFTKAQVKGTVTDTNGEPLPYVNVYIKDTYKGTATNFDGVFEFETKEKQITVVFKSLGVETKTIELQNPSNTVIKLSETSYNLNEIVLTNSEDPAYAVIRNAIASRNKNSAKADKYEADFYSKSIFKVEDTPKKIRVAINSEDPGELDSLGNGVLYLSETVSKVKFERPNKIYEQIIASKVAGNSRGFSFNTATNSDFNFYKNFISFGTKHISPIADGAFGYYKYKLENTFYDQKKLINKIKVIAKRKNEPVFEGYLYIVEDSWEVYGTQLTTNGNRMQNGFVNELTITQDYSYNSSNKIWAKNIQTLNFDASFFGIKFKGNYSYVFTNYSFVEEFSEGTFGKEIVKIEADSNKKDDAYWQNNRQIALNEEEIANYHKKDSIYEHKNSKVYLDSIDKKSNTFKIQDIVMGYTYKNRAEKYSINYSALGSNFNTIQGYSLSTGFTFNKENEEETKSYKIKLESNYGLLDKRFRPQLSFNKTINKLNLTSFEIKAGTELKQFNNQNPISPLINGISSLFFARNFAKFYNSEFAAAKYETEITNGIMGAINASYEMRKAVFNNTDKTWYNGQSHSYTSNNPFNPLDFTNSGLVKNDIYKIGVNTEINFDQKYISRPDGKIRVKNNKYPILNFNFTKAFSGSELKNSYEFLSSNLKYNHTFGNKGTTYLNLEAGTFFNNKNVQFIDQKHFNGNQTHINLNGSYLNSFALLSYYSHSTANNYLELHAEHNFKGFLLNKIPLINKLQWNTIIGLHQISTHGQKPYQELSVGIDNIGIGAYKFFRVNYVRSYQNEYQGDGFLFGLKFNLGE